MVPVILKSKKNKKERGGFLNLNLISKIPQMERRNIVRSSKVIPEF